MGHVWLGWCRLIGIVSAIIPALILCGPARGIVNCDRMEDHPSDGTPIVSMKHEQVEERDPCLFEYPDDVCMQLNNFLQSEGVESNVGTGLGSRLAVLDKYKWPSKSTIACKFLNGEKWQQDEVKRVASEWEPLTGLRFTYLSSDSKTNVRIRFTASRGGGWSNLGVDCNRIPEPQATMELGVNDAVNEEGIRRVILHEFGHMIGFIHEHQSPQMDKILIPAQAYKYFKDCCKWSKDDVDSNVLYRFRPEEATASRLDVDSIMIYYLPPYLFEDGIGVPWNTTLSKVDKLYATRFYDAK